MDEHGTRLLKEWKERIAREDRIFLWEPGCAPHQDPAYGQDEPSMVAFLPQNATAGPVSSPPVPPAEGGMQESVQASVQRMGAVLVCAGGGFAIKAPHEGWPICEWLNRNGVAAFLLDYRLTPYRLPTIIGDAKRAMRLIRHRADDWGVDPHKIGILGFSAGGQITVTVSTLFDEGNPEAIDPVERVSCRPDVQLPCYPAVSLLSRTKANEGWSNYVRSVLGEEAGEEDARAWSAECQVKSDTPPAFLWGTCDDFLYEFWPPYLAALREKGVSFESHIFSNGPHGMGLAEEHPTASGWPERAMTWLRVQGF